MIIKNKTPELDNLICNYFGLDYDLIDDSEDVLPKIDAYNERSGRPMQEGLIEDVDSFLALGEQLDAVFDAVYGQYFQPSLWGMTPREFLLMVRKQVKSALSNPHYL